jgi:hypothetical protein
MRMKGSRRAPITDKTSGTKAMSFLKQQLGRNGLTPREYQYILTTIQDTRLYNYTLVSFLAFT